MSAIPVFAGPSLPPEVRPAGPFDWRDPATAGDLLKLVDRPPMRLCLIDGYFDSRPAPWHKELLILMARGTVIFGASSMGALRAAELHPFGMVGVGAIFAAYRDGRLTGDDEVALIHAPGELGWAPLSVPMVEVRATLAAACRAGLLPPAVARRIRARAHGIHFRDRDWPAMAKTCMADGLLGGDAFHSLQAMHVPLKRRDALACLAAALQWRGAAPRTDPPPNTCFVRRLAEELASRPPSFDEGPRSLPRRNVRSSGPAEGCGT